MKFIFYSTKFCGQLCSQTFEWGYIKTLKFSQLSLIFLYWNVKYKQVTYKLSILTTVRHGMGLEEKRRTFYAPHLIYNKILKYTCWQHNNLENQCK